MSPSFRLQPLPVLPEAPEPAPPPPAFVYSRPVVGDLAETVAIGQARIPRQRRMAMANESTNILREHDADPKYTLHFIDDIDYSPADLIQPVWADIYDAIGEPWDEVFLFQGFRYVASAWKHIAYPVLTESQRLWCPFELMRVDLIGNIDNPSNSLQDELFRFLNQPDHLYKRAIIRRKEASLLGTVTRQRIFPLAPNVILANRQDDIKKQTRRSRRPASFVAFEKRHRKIKFWRQRFSTLLRSKIAWFNALSRRQSVSKKTWLHSV